MKLNGINIKQLLIKVLLIDALKKMFLKSMRIMEGLIRKIITSSIEVFVSLLLNYPFLIKQKIKVEEKKTQIFYK
jgi:hypothetical protein